MTLADWAVLVAAIAGGAVASVAGFGIGSFLTPVLAFSMPMQVAVAVVSVPHAVATAVRLWILRDSIDRELLKGFGLASAAGSLVGAATGSALGTQGLTLVLGLLLVFVGLIGLRPSGKSWTIPSRFAMVGGFVSGIFGGWVGNQGGVRTATMLGLEVQKSAFVATATASALLVDLARLPVYVVMYADALRESGRWIGLSTMGVLLGTWLGLSILRQIPEAAFKRVVAAILLAIGMVVLIHLLFPSS